MSGPYGSFVPDPGKVNPALSLHACEFVEKPTSLSPQLCPFKTTISVGHYYENKINETDNQCVKASELDMYVWMENCQADD